MTFESRFDLLQEVKIRDVKMLVVAVDFLPGGRIRYCLSWLSNGSCQEMWIGQDELLAFMKMK